MSPVQPFLVGFDIETDTRVDGLDPTNSPIIAVAVTTPIEETVFQGDETQILESVDSYIRSLPTGYLVTWNGSTFDLPFFEKRAEMLSVSTALRIRKKMTQPMEEDRVAVEGSWGRLVHLDGLSLYRADVGIGLGLPCGLKPLARFVGLDAVELDSAEIHLADPDDIREYVASDARVAVQLVERRMPHALLGADPSPQPGDAALGNSAANADSVTPGQPLETAGTSGI
jgi:hypothetical protein